MVLTFEDYLVLWAIFFFAVKKAPAVLGVVLGEGEAREVDNELPGPRDAGPGDLVGRP